VNPVRFLRSSVVPMGAIYPHSQAMWSFFREIPAMRFYPQRAGEEVEIEIGFRFREKPQINTSLLFDLPDFTGPPVQDISLRGPSGDVFSALWTNEKVCTIACVKNLTLEHGPDTCPSWENQTVERCEETCTTNSHLKLVLSSHKYLNTYNPSHTLVVLCLAVRELGCQNMAYSLKIGIFLCWFRLVERCCRRGMSFSKLLAK